MRQAASGAEQQGAEHEQASKCTGGGASAELGQAGRRAQAAGWQDCCARQRASAGETASPGAERTRQQVRAGDSGAGA